MKYVGQFGLILLFSFLGEALHLLIPLPIPASVYGLVLLLIALLSGIVKVSHIKETAKFLIEIMPIMFLPAAVGLLESFHILKPIWVPVIVITVSTSVLALVVTGRVTQAIIRREKEDKDS